MKKKERKLNVRLLRRVQRWIADEPRRFRISWFIKEGKENPDNQPIASCNTTACIAGAALLLSGARVIRNQPSTSLRAAKLLGLDENEVDKLFILDFWPAKFRGKYNYEGTFLAYNNLTLAQVRRNAKIAVKRIDYFIDHRE